MANGLIFRVLRRKPSPPAPLPKGEGRFSKHVLSHPGRPFRRIAAKRLTDPPIRYPPKNRHILGGQTVDFGGILGMVAVVLPCRNLQQVRNYNAMTR